MKAFKIMASRRAWSTWEVAMSQEASCNEDKELAPGFGKISVSQDVEKNKFIGVDGTKAS